LFFRRRLRAHAAGGQRGVEVLDARRKKQVVEMLETASGETTVTVTTLLKEIDSKSRGE